MSNISLVTFAAKTVTPQDDALVYESALGAGGIIYGAEVTIKNANTLHVNAGHGVICGRKFTIYDADIPVALSSSGTLLGRLYIHLDLSNASDPIELLTETGQTLSPLEQDENVNIVNGIYDINIASFTVSTSTIANLRNVYPKVSYANSGSLITITTEEPSLIGEEVTVTDGTDYVYAVFNAEGVAELKNVLMTGTLTVSATDGTDIASASLSVPYYGAYTLDLAFWGATLAISTPNSELYGQQITIKNSSDETVGTTQFGGSGTASFIVKEPDTYTLSVSYGGNVFSNTVNVTTQTTYQVVITTGFAWQTWVNTAQYLDSSDYSTIDDLLADEKAVRELFLEHSCVDYLADVLVAYSIISKIFNDNYCAKWINDSDYALDKLYANSVLADVMDEADKYGYGEWVIVDNTTTPPTWGAKGAVPKMTSNTAPYGVASATGSSANAYKVFDGNDSTDLELNGVSGGSVYYQYEFTNPINVKKVKIRNGGEAYSVLTYDLLVSNDGSNFTALTKTDSTSGLEIESEVEGEDFYKYIRVKPLTTTGKPSAGVAANTYADVVTLQFYGRQLSVSVPVMTSNTAPFGSVECTNNNMSDPIYKAFGITDVYSNNYNDTFDIIYDFGNETTKVFMVQLGNRDSGRKYSFELYGSLDKSTWELLKDTTPITINAIIPYDVSTSIYRYIKFRITSTGSYGASLYNLNIYGLDYSEKEFEAGTNKKWLYDHGVELETISAITSGGTATKEDSQLYFKQTAVGTAGFSVDNIDLTPYSLMRCKVGDIANISSDNVFAGLEVFAVGTAITPSAMRVAVRNITNNNYMPNNEYLDISSCNANYEVAIDYSGSAIRNAEFTIPEWWLE